MKTWHTIEGDIVGVVGGLANTAILQKFRQILQYCNTAKNSEYPGLYQQIAVMIICLSIAFTFKEDPSWLGTFACN